MTNSPSLAKLASALACIAVLAGCATASQPGFGGPQTSALDPTIRQAALAAETAGDYSAAAGHYRSLISRQPDDLELSLSLARALRYVGQASQAVDVLERALAAHGPKADLYKALGKANLAADRLEVARHYLAEAGILAPDDWEIYSAQGVVFDYLGRLDAARHAYTQALALSPDNPRILNNLGLSLAQAGLLDKAAETFRRAIEHPRAPAQVRQNLALILALKGDLAGAERLARQDLDPETLRANLATFRRLASP